MSVTFWIIYLFYNVADSFGFSEYGCKKLRLCVKIYKFSKVPLSVDSHKRVDIKKTSPNEDV